MQKPGEFNKLGEAKEFIKLYCELYDEYSAGRDASEFLSFVCSKYIAAKGKK